MTAQQLDQIKTFAQTFYDRTGHYHAWDHIEMVRTWALRLSDQFPKINQEALEAACYLHDIGRTVKDEGHPQISADLAKPFLEQLGLDAAEIAIILEAVACHDKSQIGSAKSDEAKLLFDADKLQISSVFGFMRCAFWLVEERKMDFVDACNFLFKYVEDVNQNYLQTAKAKEIAVKEGVTIRAMMEQMNSWIADAKQA